MFPATLFGMSFQYLKRYQSNRCRSAVEAWSKATPEVPRWTKKTVGEHITVGGLGATPVGTPEQIADEMERWVREADVDGFNLVSLPLLRSLWHIANCRRHMPSSPVRSRTSSTSCFLCSEAGDCSTTTMLPLVGRTVRTCTVNRGRAGLPRITQLRSTGGEQVLTSTKSQSKPWRLYLDEQGKHICGERQGAVRFSYETPNQMV